MDKVIKNTSIKINSISNLTSLGVEIAIGFLLTPFIISHLGKTGYGIWTLIGSFIGYYGILNLGVGAAIIRYLARYYSQENYKSINETASTALVMFSIIGAFAIFLSLILANPLAHFFKVQPEHLLQFKQVIWILGVTTALGFPGSLFVAIVQSHEHFVPVNIIYIVSSLIRTALIVFLLKMGWGLIGVAWAYFIASMFSYIGNICLTRFYIKHLCLRVKFAKISILKMLLIFGGPQTVIVIAEMMNQNLDSFVIGKLISIEDVGVYGVAAVIMGIMIQFVIASVSALMPRFSYLHGAGKLDELKKLLTKSLSVSSLISFYLCILAIILGKYFILLWVGEKFIDAYIFLWIISISAPFGLSQKPSQAVLYALKKHHFYAIATIVEGIANVIISIILAPILGITGVALGTMISALIFKIVVMPVYVSKVMGISIFQYIKPMIIPCVIASAMVIIAFSINMDYLVKPNIFSLIRGVFIVSIVFIIPCLFLEKIIGHRFS